MIPSIKYNAIKLPQPISSISSRISLELKADDNLPSNAIFASDKVIIGIITTVHMVISNVVSPKISFELYPFALRNKPTPKNKMEKGIA